MGTNQTFNHIAIPIDWEVIKFNELANIVRGSSPRPAGDPKYFNGKYIPWLTVASLTNIPESQIEVLETDSFLTEEGAKQSRILEIGTLILSNSGATLGVAKLLGIKCCANDGIAAFLNWKHQLVNIHYAFYFLNSKTQYFRDVVAPGNGQPNLNTELIGIENIYFPPLPEQKAIASCLSTWDEAIKKSSQLIAQKELRKKWLMQQLLTGKKRLKGFSGEWKSVLLSQCFQFIKSYSISRDGLSSDEGEVYCIHYGDIHAYYETDVLDFQKQSNIPLILDKQLFINKNDYLKDGDVIMADVSEDYDGVGETVIVHNLEDKKAIGGLHTFVLRDFSGETALNFRAYLFASENVKNQLRRKATGSSVYGISKTTLNALVLFLPSFEEQTAIANILQTADKEIEFLKSKLWQLKEQKKGLMQVLLTGKKRLKIENQ